MFKKIVGILICTLFIGTSSIPSICGNIKTDDNNFNSGNSTFLNPPDQLDQQQPIWYGAGSSTAGSNLLGQSFVPTLNTLTRVELICEKGNNAVGLVIVSIKSDPNGSDLTSISLPAENIPLYGGSWDTNGVEFDFPDIYVTPGQKYYIIFKTPGSIPGETYIMWGNHDDNPYPPGEMYFGSEGHVLPLWYNEDFCFKTYGYNYGGNLPPSVDITYPMNGETVNGTISIKGTVFDPNGISDVDWIMIQIDENDWTEIDYSQIGFWSYIWDSTTVEDGSHIVRIIASDGSLQSGVVTKEFFVKNKEDPEPEKNPDLYCEGELGGVDVKPGEIKTGTFKISNIGDLGSNLDWFIEEYPSWGIWSFSSVEGLDLTPEDGDVIIQVNITAPDEPESIFNGTIKIVNQENSSDYEIVQVTLSTPKNKLYFNTFYNIIEQLIKRFSFFEKILNQSL